MALPSPRFRRTTTVRVPGLWPQIADTDFYNAVLAMPDLKAFWTFDPYHVVPGTQTTVTNHIPGAASLTEISALSGLTLDSTDLPRGGQVHQVGSFAGNTTMQAGVSLPAGGGTATWTQLVVLKVGKEHAASVFPNPSQIIGGHSGSSNRQALFAIGSSIIARIGTVGDYVDTTDRYAIGEHIYLIRTWNSVTKVQTLCVDGAPTVEDVGTTQTYVNASIYVGGDESTATLYAKIAAIVLWFGTNGIDGELTEAAGRADDLVIVKSLAESMCGRLDLLSPPPSGVASWLPHVNGLPPVYYADFSTNGGANNYWNGVKLQSFDAFMTSIDGTFARSSTATRINESGLLESVSDDVARFDYRMDDGLLRGMLYENAATNLALWSSDLTNAAWLKAGSTAAKDQVGLDGVSNSASSATATGANGTVMQSVTAASASYAFSVYLKRITGTGTIYITIDGGSTWTAVTLTEFYQRFSVVTTLANPQFGIRIGTSGDKVAFARAQLEAGAEATSSIATTAASATRAADEMTVGIPSIVGGLKFVFDDGTSQIVTVTPGVPYTITGLTGRRIKTFGAWAGFI